MAQSGYQKIKAKLQTMAAEATAVKMNSLNSLEAHLKNENYKVAQDQLTRVREKDSQIELIREIYKIVEDFEKNESK